LFAFALLILSYLLTLSLPFLPLPLRSKPNHSESAMQEARSLRRHFSNFVSLALPDSTPHDGLLSDTTTTTTTTTSGKRWGPRELTVMAELNRVKASVREALLEGGMDTPEVLRLLQGLVATGHVYMQGGREEGCVEEVLGNVAGYVVFVLRLFGLQSIGDPRLSSSSSSLSSSSSSSSAAAAATESLAGALVDFRARVRAAALEDEQERRRLRKAGMTDEKQNGSSSGELSQKLLQLCDDFRDGELARLGVQVKDLGAGKCHWTLEAPPSPPPPPSITAPAPAPATAAVTAALPVGRKPQHAKASIALSDLFKQGLYEGQFSSFDALGIPTADAKGHPISKTLRAKLEKKHARHAVLLAEGKKKKEEKDGEGRRRD
jgi:cysteinyl-tRNA synthetase